MVKKKFEKLATIFKALTNAKRLEILALVSEKKISVNGLSDKLGTRKSNTSQHLATLRYLGFVTSERDGKKVFYTIEPKMKKLVKYLLGI